MSHVSHPALPGYDERQILVDGCPECEQRSSDCIRTLGFMDGSKFARAWRRAYLWQYGGSAALGTISEVEMPVLHMLWAVQVMLERCCRVPLGTLPVPDLVSEVYGGILDEATRHSLVTSKAEGLIRNSNHKRGDDLRVVQEWWDGLVEAVGMGPCEEGRCGPIVAADEDDYDPTVLGLPLDLISPHQHGYCERCHRYYRWSVTNQRWEATDQPEKEQR